MNFYQPLSQFEPILYSNTVIVFSDYNIYFHFYWFLFFKFFYDLNVYELYDFWNSYKFFLNYFIDTKILSHFLIIFYFLSEILVYFYIIFLDFIFMNVFLNNNLIEHNILKNFKSILDIKMNNDSIQNNEIWLDVSINKFYTTTVFVLFYLMIFLIFCFKNFRFYKNTWNITIFSFLEDFLSGTIIQQLGIKKGQKYSIFLKSFFFLILFSNVFGLIPFSFTTTSHLIFTFSLSLAILLGITFLGFYLQGISFLKLLIPGGAPVFLLPLLIPIEFISYVARCFSLAIRLFANMMSGHTLLNILSGFILKIAKNGFLFLSLAPLLVVLAVSILELGIAFLQAYVFLVLVCIYLKDGFQASH